MEEKLDDNTSYVTSQPEGLAGERRQESLVGAKSGGIILFLRCLHFDREYLSTWISAISMIPVLLLTGLPVFLFVPAALIVVFAIIAFFHLSFERYRIAKLKQLRTRLMQSTEDKALALGLERTEPRTPYSHRFEGLINNHPYTVIYSERWGTLTAIPDNRNMGYPWFNAMRVKSEWEVSLLLENLRLKQDAGN